MNALIVFALLTASASGVLFFLAGAYVYRCGQKDRSPLPAIHLPRRVHVEEPVKEEPKSRLPKVSA